MAEAHWYVVHTYSGYENKVKANIDKTIENIFGVVIAYYLAVFCGKGECKNEIVNLIVVK